MNNLSLTYVSGRLDFKGLYHLVQIDEKFIPEGYGLERFKKGLKKKNLGNNVDWKKLNDFATIRNCLLHANGRVDISKKNDEIRKKVGEIGINLLEIKHIGPKAEKLNLKEELPRAFNSICLNFLDWYNSAP